MAHDRSAYPARMTTAAYSDIYVQRAMDPLRAVEILFFTFVLLYSYGAIIQNVILGPDQTIALEDNPGRSTLQMIWAVIYLVLLGFVYVFRNQLYGAFMEQRWIIILSLYLVASTIWSSSPNVTLQDSIVIGLGTLIGGYIGVRFSTEQIFHLIKYVAIIGVFGSLILVAVWPEIALMTSIHHNGLWRGAFTHKNVTGLASLIAIIAFLFCYRHNIYLRIFFVAAAVVLLVGARASTSFIAFGVILAVFFVQRPLSVRGMDVFLVITGGLLLSSFVGLLLLLNLEDFVGLFGKDLTFTGRTVLWEYGFQSFLTKPFLGFGLSAFWHDTTEYGGLAVRALAGWNAPGIHNGWLELMLAIGLVGTVIFSIVFFGLMQKTYYMMREFPGQAYFYVMMFCILLLVYSLATGVFLLRNSIIHVMIIAFSFSIHREMMEHQFAQRNNIGQR